MSGAAPDPIWITEEEVCGLIDMGDAIAALERGLSLEAAGKAENMVKTHVLWDGGHTMHSIGAVFPDIVGTKSWAHTEGGATPLLTLWDKHGGNLLAIIEAFALGQLRTGGISGVAAKALSKRDARTMALIGSGRQSMTQLASVAAVRELAEVRIFSPTPANRQSFIEKAKAALGLNLVAADSVASACKGADIVTLVTRAREPVLASSMLEAGAHINAVGAISPERMEFEPSIIDRCTLLAGDSPLQVRNLSREFMTRFGSDEAAWQRLQPLSSLIGKPRPPGADLTLFKAMGMGISDLSLGIEVLTRARARGLGRTMPHPKKAQPNLRAAISVR
jgi:alanine dehydrogenase